MEAKERDVFQSLEIMKEDRKIAYFSMEICVDARIPTYSGGLGVLAGDMLRSSADLRVPLLGVTLLYKKGYLHQKMGKEGIQQELPEEWNPQDYMQLLPNKILIEIEGRKVWVQAWNFCIEGLDSQCVPVFFWILIYRKIMFMTGVFLISYTAVIKDTGLPRKLYWGLAV